MTQTCDATSNFSQTWEVTTNLTFGGQTSDATTDSTCDNNRTEKFLNDKRLNHFVARNMDNLVVEIASGGGEALDTLAEMVEVSLKDRRKFFNALQDNFEDVYTSASITHEALVRNIAGILERMSYEEK